MFPDHFSAVQILNSFFHSWGFVRSCELSPCPQFLAGAALGRSIQKGTPQKSGTCSSMLNSDSSSLTGGIFQPANSPEVSFIFTYLDLLLRKIKKYIRWHLNLTPVPDTQRS